VTPEALQERILDFAVVAGRIADDLPDTRLGRHVAGQLVWCGTSPAANYAEGCAAESRSDFIHKLSICLKELRETRTWLRLIQKAGLLPGNRVGQAFDECSQLCNIVGQSVLTARQNAPRR
jgi:four helix bundle protein